MRFAGSSGKFLDKHLRYRGGKGGLAVIHVSYCPHVQVWLGPLVYFLCDMALFEFLSLYNDVSTTTSLRLKSSGGRTRTCDTRIMIPLL